MIVSAAVLMRQQTGISLIEILISIFILSLMLFGWDAMQITALREAKAAYYFSVASQQVRNMVEYLNAHPDVDYNEQLLRWNKQNAAGLPQGRGIIKRRDHAFELAIFWGKSEECNKNKVGQSGCIIATTIVL